MKIVVIRRGPTRTELVDGRYAVAATQDLRELVAGVVAAPGSPEIDATAASLAAVDLPTRSARRARRSSRGAWRAPATEIALVLSPVD